MERRAFLKLLCIGAGVVAAGAPAEALTPFMPLAGPSHDPDLAPQPGIATSKDMKTWRGDWRKHRMVIGVALIDVIGVVLIGVIGVVSVAAACS